MKLKGYQVELRQVSEIDIEMLRKWRNDPEVSQFMLNQKPISREQQSAWYKKIQRDPGQIHFVISYRDQPIGAANLKARGLGKTLDTANAIEPGLYIADKRYRNNILAFAPTLLLNDYCFNTLGTTRLLAVVKASNVAALNYNQKLGYKVENEGELLEISLTHNNYLSATKQLRSLLSR